MCVVLPGKMGGVFKKARLTQVIRADFFPSVLTAFFWRFLTAKNKSDGVIGKVSIHQVSKGAWRMPWHLEAMKDVASCEKLRGAASRR